MPELSDIISTNPNHNTETVFQTASSAQRPSENPASRTIVWTYTINPETHSSAKDMGHRHYRGKGIVYFVGSCGTVDGPGLWCVLFPQGCLMRCLYRHSRDTRDFHIDKCQEMTVEQMMKQVMSYHHYLEAAGDGITVTGDEPLLQYEFTRGWLTAYRRHGIHTCLDTNSHALHYDSILEGLFDHINLVMLDLKQIDPEIHKVLAGIPNTKTLNSARYLVERGQSIRVRYVIVPDCADDKCSAHLLGGFIGDMENVGAVELLPYHELGAHKWALCGGEYKPKGVHPPPKEVVLKIKEILEGYGKSITY